MFYLCSTWASHSGKGWNMTDPWSVQRTGTSESTRSIPWASLCGAWALRYWTWWMLMKKYLGTLHCDNVHSEALLGNLWLPPSDVQLTSASAAYILGEIWWRDTVLFHGKKHWTKVIFFSNDCSYCSLWYMLSFSSHFADCLES